ncbi:glycosyltransferase WbuB [Marixanthomonas spongiae]|uniref:Glycosyltransferase WbuB n=2 Tax=Marixanthomonas spongiae TaxID=2174845 RepID=A0A2U0I1Z4_9FLAO|nr:glycosyltransferase WbuB [Marixanthomonas spongiae]
MNNKEVLLISNYFPPEKGAAPNRMHTLAVNLNRANYNVHVVCPMPNYPKGAIFKEFKGSIYKKEVEAAGTIHRLWLWPSNSSNKFVRLLSMLSFSMSLSFFFLFKRSPKKIFIQYSPVFVGFTAVFWTWLLGKKRILNVSDLWPLAGLEMGLLHKGAYYSVLEWMEHFCYKKSHLVVGQSEEILTHVKARCNTAPFLYRNIPDFNPPSFMETSLEKPITLVYAGLLGIAQGLTEICSKIQLPDDVELHIYGAGPETDKISKINKKNIVYHGEIDRTELHKTLQQYDLAFIPLTNRIYGSVPSKLFEYTRLGLAVIYFAGGEGGKLVETHQLGWNIPVSDFDALQAFISELSIEKLKALKKEEVQKKAVKAFNFQKQFNNFVKALESL